MVPLQANRKIIAQNFNFISLQSTQPCLDDVYNRWAFVVGFLKTLIDRVHNTVNQIFVLSGLFVFTV